MAFNVFFLLYFGLRVSLAASPSKTTVGNENQKLKDNPPPMTAFLGKVKPEVSMVDTHLSSGVGSVNKLFA